MFCCALLATFLAQPFVLAGSAASRAAAAGNSLLHRVFPALAMRASATVAGRRLVPSRWAGSVIVAEALLAAFLALGYAVDANAAAVHTQLPLWHICHAVFGAP